MKRTIDGRRYDTATAHALYTVQTGDPFGGMSRGEETLYRTRNGRYFLAGEGGAMSRWATSLGNNSWSGGEGIEVLSAREALAWCERHDCEIDETMPEVQALVTDA